MDRATITLVDLAKCDLFFLLKSRMSRNIAKVSKEYIENHQKYDLFIHYVSHNSVEIRQDNTQSRCISIKNLPICWRDRWVSGKVLFEGRIWDIVFWYFEQPPMDLYDCGDIDELESETYNIFLERQLFHDYIIADFIKLYNLFKQGNKVLVHEHIVKRGLRELREYVDSDDFVQKIKNYAIKKYKDDKIDEEIARFLVEYIDKPFTKIPSITLKEEYDLMEL